MKVSEGNVTDKACKQNKLSWNILSAKLKKDVIPQNNNKKTEWEIIYHASI